MKYSVVITLSTLVGFLLGIQLFPGQYGDNMNMSMDTKHVYEYTVYNSNCHCVTSCDEINTNLQP